MIIVIPKNAPVIQNLHSYYVDVRKLLEHYQGEIGCGGILLSAPAAAGAIFFDKDGLLDGAFRSPEQSLIGRNAVEHLAESGSTCNFRISVFRLSARAVCYWASIPAAESSGQELSVEAVDLDGLIERLASERVSGYVAATDGRREAAIFLDQGRIIGGAYPWSGGDFSHLPGHPAQFVLWCKDRRALCRVGRIPLSLVKGGGSAPAGSEADTLAMLEELIGLAGEILTVNRVQPGFDRRLKQKLLAKAERFPFLDPFAGEFEFSDQKIQFHGDTPQRELVEALTETVTELAAEAGVEGVFRERLAGWAERHGRHLARLGVPGRHVYGT
jgi:hypothetical protein